MENKVLIKLVPEFGEKLGEIPGIPDLTKEIPEVSEILAEGKVDKEKEPFLLSEASHAFERKIQEIRREMKFKGRMRVFLVLPNSPLSHKFVSKVKRRTNEWIVIEEYFF